MKIIQIENLEAVSLQPYRTLRRPVEHHKQGIFVAEGGKVVERLIESECEIISVLTTPEWLEQLKERLKTKHNEIEVFIALKEVLEQIVGFHLHRGIMSVAKIPKPYTIDELLLKLSHPYFLVAVDGLTNSENLGVLVRNCVAFGVQALLVGETSSSPYLRRAVRNSMGTIFKLPVVHLENLVETLNILRTDKNIRSIAAHPSRTNKTIYDVNLSGNVCVVFGSEGEGISESVLKSCDETISIPMAYDVDSLNVGSAAAVFLYEVARCRALTPMVR
jgi:tRNA G18 (ribose-2'-O)-methylase SpoU